MSYSNNFQSTRYREIRQFSDSVADDVLKQLARQFAYPMAGSEETEAYLKSPRSYDQ